MPSNSMTALSVVEFLYIVAPLFVRILCLVYLLFSTLCPNFAIIEASITESRANIQYQ